MGASFSAAKAGSNSTTTGSGTATANAAGTKSGQDTSTYSGQQTDLQTMLSQVFASLLPSTASGGISPNVQALQTAGANSINSTAASSGDKMNRFLASRGFGQSGQVGQSQLQTELGRQSALGANASAASGLQLQQNNTALQSALNFAFANPGKSSTGSTTDTGTTSENTTQNTDATSYKFGGGVSASFIPGA